MVWRVTERRMIGLTSWPWKAEGKGQSDHHIPPVLVSVPTKHGLHSVNLHHPAMPRRNMPAASAARLSASAVAMSVDPTTRVLHRVTIYDPISIWETIWEMDTGYRYGRSQVGHQWDINGVDNVGSDINGISMGLTMWVCVIDMGYGLMIREMTVLMRSSPISIWNVLSR